MDPHAAARDRDRADEDVRTGTRVTDQELADLSRLVGRLRALPADDPVRLRAEQIAASFTRDGRVKRRKALGARSAEADAAVVSATATGALGRREDAPLATPPDDSAPAGVLNRSHRCYICKSPYRQVDSFYHRLCPGCSARNRARRRLSTDLSGRRALLTGGRVKIGFQLALMMLRDGAELLVTTRFPHDAAPVPGRGRQPGMVRPADRARRGPPRPAPGPRSLRAPQGSR